MKILFVTPYVPSQIYVRPYQILRSLVSLGHDVTLVAPHTTAEDLQSLEELSQAGMNVQATQLPRLRSYLNAALALAGNRPLQSVYAWQPELATGLRTLLASTNGTPPFDVIHVEHLRGARYGLYIQDLRYRPEFRYLNRVPIVWDSVDSISYLFQQAAKTSRKLSSRLITRLELPRTIRYERYLRSAFDYLLVTSPVDRDAFDRLIDSPTAAAPIAVLPNGVDLDYFTPGSEEREPDTLVVSGKMSYHANITMVLHLVRDILPHVWEQRPQVKLWVAGKDPDPVLQRLAEDPRIVVTGTVPDLRPYLQRATLAVSPIQYGAGIQNKVLQAMACGTPVVCTPQAISALGVIPGENLLTAENPAEFGRAIVYLLDDPEKRVKLGLAAREFVEAHHDWHRITGDLVNVYQRAQAKLNNEKNG
jgi:glycosyltransferase involved in cell wall biosynthesis